MGTSLIVTAGAVRTASQNRNKPRKVFRGVIRTLIRKTKAKLQAISNSDGRAYQRGLLLGYDAALVMGLDNSVNGRAFARVMNRLQECLDAKEGDE